MASKWRLLKDGTFEIDGGFLVYGVQKYYGKRMTAHLKPLYVESGEERILIDTGIGDPPERYSSAYKVKKDEDLMGSLKGMGLSPEDITMVINTHLHFDHTGFNNSFTGARFLAQTDEIRYSAQPDRFQRGAYIKDNIKDIDFWALDGECEVAPGVTVIPTPGHTPGHQSVIIELEDEVLIYTGDVSPLRFNLEKDIIVGILHDPVAAQRSLSTICALSDWFPGKLKRYIFSHDME